MARGMKGYPFDNPANLVIIIKSLLTFELSLK